MNKTYLCSKFSIVFLFILNFANLQAQSIKSWIDDHDLKKLNQFKLSISMDENFNYNKKAYCFEEQHTMMYIFGCLFNYMESKDGNFRLFLQVHSTVEKHEVLRRNIPQAGAYNNLHIANTRGILMKAIGNEAYNNWRKYTTYATPTEAKSRFNADTVLSFPLKLKLLPNNTWSDFNNVEVINVVKKNLGQIAIYIFFKENDRKDLQKIIRRVDKMFEFKDVNFSPYEIKNIGNNIQTIRLKK